MDLKRTKKCPRCGEKLPLSARTCSYCDLNFSRLSNVSNQEAKKAIRLRKKEYVLMSENWPVDVTRWKVLLLCGFLGLVGAHNFAVGRYKKAVFCMVMTVIMGVLASLTSFPDYFEIIIAFTSCIGSIPLVLWVVDFVLILIGKYRIPVALPVPEKEIVKK